MIAAKMVPASLSEPVPIGEVGRHLPGRPSAQAVFRWHNKGLIGANGERIKLDTIKIGGRRFVEPAALESFLAALQEAPEPAAEKASQVGDREAARRAEAADAALESMGF